MNNISTRLVIILSSLFALINFLVLIVLKHHINGLQLQKFNIAYTGNFILVILAVSLLFSLSISYLKRKELDTKTKILFLALSLTPLLIIVLIILVMKNIILLPEAYAGIYPFKRVSIGLLFVSNLFCIIYLLSFAWLHRFYRGVFLILKTFGAAVFMMILLILFAFFYSINTSKNTNAMKADKKLGIIPGAAVWSYDKPSPLFLGRIEKALSLYDSGVIAAIQVMGGSAPGELSEAVVARNYLLNKGVDTNDIFLEKVTSTTSMQVKYIWENYSDYDGYKGLVFISDKFHLPRIIEMCKFFEMDVSGAASGYQLNPEKLVYFRIRESIALLLFWLFGI